MERKRNVNIDLSLRCAQPKAAFLIFFQLIIIIWWHTQVCVFDEAEISNFFDSLNWIHSAY